jgi:hypothetical protein
LTTTANFQVNPAADLQRPLHTIDIYGCDIPTPFAAALTDDFYPMSFNRDAIKELIIFQ